MRHALALILVLAAPSLALGASTLSWVDNASNEFGFVIQRKLNQYDAVDGGIVTTGTYADLTKITTPNTQGFVDNGAIADPNLENEYCYRVAAYNNDNAGVEQRSGYSNEACKRFPVIIPPPAAPSGLTAN
jgi:hypothetical protein